MSAVVNQEKCAGCGICIEVCPVQAIILNSERKAQIDSEKCIECGSCVRECPNQAIELVQEVTYPSVQRGLPQVAQREALQAPATTFSVPTSKSQPGGILRSIIRKLPALWETVRPVVNTITSSQFRTLREVKRTANNSLGQRIGKGRGRKHRHRGGKR